MRRLPKLTDRGRFFRNLVLLLVCALLWVWITQPAFTPDMAFRQAERRLAFGPAELLARCEIPPPSYEGAPDYLQEGGGVCYLGRYRDWWAVAQVRSSGIRWHAEVAPFPCLAEAPLLVYTDRNGLVFGTIADPAITNLELVCYPSAETPLMPPPPFWSKKASFSFAFPARAIPDFPKLWQPYMPIVMRERFSIRCPQPNGPGSIPTAQPILPAIWNHDR